MRPEDQRVLLCPGAISSLLLALARSSKLMHGLACTRTPVAIRKDGAASGADKVSPAPAHVRNKCEWHELIRPRQPAGVKRHLSLKYATHVYRLIPDASSVICLPACVRACACVHMRARVCGTCLEPLPPTPRRTLRLLLPLAPHVASHTTTRRERPRSPDLAPWSGKK